MEKYILFSLLVYLPLVFGTLKWPTVFISVLVRNKEHTLPYFLTHLQNLTYPKSQITLHLISDHNQDRTLQVLDSWIKNLPNNQYHQIIQDFVPCSGIQCLLAGESGPVGWPHQRFRHIMQLKQNSLAKARRAWAEYYWSLDADVFLTNPETLANLMDKEKIVVAPMLPTTGLYSNFWAGISDTYYYQRTDDYKKILERKSKGCFDVPMVHTSVLIDLRHEESDLLTYLPENIHDYPGPHDDIIVFALSATLKNIPLYVCNDVDYGILMVPLDDDQTIELDKAVLLNTKLEVTTNNQPMKADPIFEAYLPKLPTKSRLGFSQIYLINLKRRSDRFERMMYNLEQLGIHVKVVEAVDGRQLDDNYIESHGIKMMPDFSEPYHNRPLTYGEIGCFMSHFNIWQDMIENNYEKVLIFEDDIRFRSYFLDKLQYLMDELETTAPDWDLVFLGRKILQNADEPWVEGSEQLVYVDYSYWTLSYILTQAGAAKLLEEKPLGKMVPVDEYLPIMYDRHPNQTWKSHYNNRNLNALSVEPLLVHPTHYTGEKGYISDTEGTKTVGSQAQTIPCHSGVADCTKKDEL